MFIALSASKQCHMFREQSGLQNRWYFQRNGRGNCELIFRDDARLPCEDSSTQNERKTADTLQLFLGGFCRESRGVFDAIIVEQLTALRLGVRGTSRKRFHLSTCATWRRSFAC